MRFKYLRGIEINSEVRFWWPAVVIIILLGLMLVLEDDASILESATVALVLVTFMYVVFTKRTLDEIKQQRFDASRPLLVPIGGKRGVVGHAEPPRLDYGEWLCVHNMRLGPAENIAIRLELRSGNDSPTVQLDEMLTTVEPLASGDKGRVRQWSSAGKSLAIPDGHWIVISYNDLFHRNFETEARWIKEIENWVSTRTVQVKKLRPRMGEVDYYHTAFWGNNKPTP